MAFPIGVVVGVFANEMPENHPDLGTAFAREINRIQDSDRTVRKRGLQKLSDDLPWTSKGKTKKALKQLLIAKVLPALLGATNLEDGEKNNSVLFQGSVVCLLADPIEKCRELSLQIVRKVLESFAVLSSTLLNIIVEALCQRINESPFPEVAEELRLVVIENIRRALKYEHDMHIKEGKNDEGSDDETEKIEEAETVTIMEVDDDKVPFESSSYKPSIELSLITCSKGLTDLFPAVKRACGELVYDLATLAPMLTRLHFKQIGMGLASNALHQHSKTRSISVKALGKALVNVAEDFDTVMGKGVGGQESLSSSDLSNAGGAMAGSVNPKTATKKMDLLVLFSKLIGDNNAQVRKELGIQIGNILASRFGRYAGVVNSPAELQCFVQLLLLLGDEIDDVRIAAIKSLESCTIQWRGKGSIDSTPASFDENSHILDGEIQMKDTIINSEKMEEADIAESKQYSGEKFVESHLQHLCTFLIAGISDWTADTQRRYLIGLNKTLLLAGSEAVENVIPYLLNALGNPCRDDEALIRLAAEECCSRIGSVISNKDEVVNLLIPRIAGEASGGGGDTASLRSNALRVLTHIIYGFSFKANSGNNETGIVIGKDCFLSSYPIPIDTLKLDSGNCNPECVNKIVSCLLEPSLYEFREPYMREAVLLLIRGVIDTFPSLCNTPDVEKAVLLGLIYLQGKCPGEVDVVPEVAYNELVRFANIGNELSDTDIDEKKKYLDSLFQRHFPFILNSIISFSYNAQGLIVSPSPDMIKWDTTSIHRSAFDVLIRLSPSQGWIYHDIVLKIIGNQVQLPPLLDQDTPEAHLASYEAIRGDTDATRDINLSSVRLSLMALLETWIRAGALDWQCSEHLSESATFILSEIIVKNLVWRAGRVEGTVRKVTLAAVHALLRAGSIKPNALYKMAPQLVPIITTQMDDSETSMRHIAALCLNVIFERLKGAFGHQAVTELYPTLVKRLDDSNDEVRIQSCRALGAFMSASSEGAFSGTALDYTLDQLFIHLDDPDPTIQAVVYEVIMIGAQLNKDLVWKKAHNNKTAHRTTNMCDLIIKEIQKN